MFKHYKIRSNHNIQTRSSQHLKQVFKVQIIPTSNKIVSNKVFKLSNKETFKHIKIEKTNIQLSLYSMSFRHSNLQRSDGPSPHVMY